MARRSGVRGVPESVAALRTLAGLVAGPANQASKRAMEPMLAAAKENVPVRTGRLKRALILKRVKKSPKLAPRYVIGVAPKAKAAYAVVVEWGRAANAKGHGALRGTRFMTRAFDANKAEAVRIFGRTIGPAIEEQARKLKARGR